jgi:hypothetical protein
MALTEEHRWRMFENEVFKRIFDHGRGRKSRLETLHNEEFHDLYTCSHITRVIPRRMS